MRNVRLVSQEHQFALTEDGDGLLFLEVLCGGFAMYELEMMLTDGEVEKFSTSGVDFLVKLANEIRRKSPELVARIAEK